MLCGPNNKCATSAGRVVLRARPCEEGLATRVNINSTDSILPQHTERQLYKIICDNIYQTYSNYTFLRQQS